MSRVFLIGVARLLVGQRGDRFFLSTRHTNVKNTNIGMGTTQRTVVPATAATMYFWKNRYSTKIGSPANTACAIR
jgi:hypothetical protein